MFQLIIMLWLCIQAQAPAWIIGLWAACAWTWAVNLITKVIKFCAEVGENL